MFAIDGIVDLCLAGMGFSGVLGVAQTGVGVSDGQIVRVQVPVSRQISAMKRCINSKKLSNSNGSKPVQSVNTRRLVPG